MRYSVCKFHRDSHRLASSLPLDHNQEYAFVGAMVPSRPGVLCLRILIWLPTPSNGDSRVSTSTSEKRHCVIPRATESFLTQAVQRSSPSRHSAISSEELKRSIFKKSEHTDHVDDVDRSSRRRIADQGRRAANDQSAGGQEGRRDLL